MDGSNWTDLPNARLATAFEGLVIAELSLLAIQFCVFATIPAIAQDQNLIASTPPKWNECLEVMPFTNGVIKNPNWVM